MKTRILFLVILLAVSYVGLSQTAGSVWVLEVNGDIGRGTVSYLRQGLSSAAESGADAVVIELSTPGGYLDSAIAARDAILDANIPTIAYINREAYSAGALLAIACQKIYFASAGVMGAATPVYFESGKMEEAPEKVVSATRELFAATAESRGRPTDVAEAMVDRDIAIPGLIEEGKLLTLTYTEAEQWGYSDGEVAGIDDLLSLEGLAGATVVVHQRRVIDDVVDVLTTPWVAGILIAAGVLGLIIEMIVPGFGIPGITGLVLLGLFFWSHFLVGLAGWSSIVFLFAGIVFILLEVFVFTGATLGLSGLAGLVLVGIGFYTSMVGPLAQPTEAVHAIVAVSVGLVLALAIAIFIVARLPKTRLRFGGVILSQAITGRAFDKKAEASDGKWVGRRGVAVTDLHPVGMGEFDGERTDVVCEEGFLPKGMAIVVTKDEGYRKVVKKSEREVKA